MPQILPTLSLNAPRDKNLDLVCSILDKQGYLVGKDLSGITKFTTKVEDAVIYFQQTHLGPDGKPLIDTGVVDEATWWALKNPAGAAQKSGLVPSIPKGIDGMRYSVLQHALAEHSKGVVEKPNGSNRSKDIDTYLPDWLRNKLAAGEKGPAWCCFFVNAMVTRAFGGSRPWGPYIGSCAKLYEVAEDACEIQATLGELPTRCTPGDIFVMLHPKTPFKPQTGHVGFVLRVSKNGSIINTVEGNCGNRVKVGTRSTSTMQGFINLYGDGGRSGFSRQLLATAGVGNDDTR